jgi:tripartite-type tricarboxylate transporter receptor subunit TctC
LLTLKQTPGKLNYASQGNGSVSHIGTEIFKQTTGVDMVHIPYKGSGPAIQDVLAGQVQVFIATPSSVMQHVQSGKLKGLAVTGKIVILACQMCPPLLKPACHHFNWNLGLPCMRQ